MSKPKLLDLFCGAGGASMGYHRAGFDVVGVDIAPQPNYPFEFFQGDALAIDLAGFDIIHASPPCQSFTAYKRRPNHVKVENYPNLIPQVREMLMATDLPYIIENVPGAPLRSPIRLCGSSFGLNVRRHRMFEVSVPLLAPPCDHAWQKASGSFPAATNRGANSRWTVQIGSWNTKLAVQKEAMGIEWMTLEELSESIPPAYTEWIGKQLFEMVERGFDDL